jgi:hypothetical protein
VASCKTTQEKLANTGAVRHLVKRLFYSRQQQRAFSGQVIPAWRRGPPDHDRLTFCLGEKPKLRIIQDPTANLHPAMLYPGLKYLRWGNET